MFIDYLFRFFMLNFAVLIFLALIIAVLNFPCSSFRFPTILWENIRSFRWLTENEQMNHHHYTG